MAELIGAAIVTSIASAEVAGTAIVGSLTVAQLVGGATLLGGAYAANLLLSSAQGDQKQKVAAQQFSSRQAIPARKRAYGTVRIAGPKVAYDSVGGVFVDAIYLGEGPYDSIQEFWLDDAQAALPPGSLGGAAGIAPWIGLVLLDARLGTQAQPVSGLAATLPYWTADHRLDGCAYLVVHSTAPAQKFFTKFFPNGAPPAGRVTVRASKVRNVSDPAQTTDPASWAWSDRAGPCIYDFVTHGRWGMRVPDAMMSKASFTAFNALCEEAVLDRNGDPRPRYVLGGEYDLVADDPADTLQKMLDTCDATLWLEVDGTIGITGGRFPEPSVTLTHDDLISIGAIEVGSGKLSAFNRLKLSYSSPVHNYQIQEGDAWDDLAAQAEAGETLEADFSRPWVQWHEQLRRLAKIKMGKDNPEFRITGLVTKMSGAAALFEESITLSLPEYGIEAVFLVQRAVASPANRTCTFDLTSIAREIYEFDPVTEEGDGPPLPGEQAASTPPAPPESLVVLVDRRVVSGDLSAVFVRALATEPTRADLTLIGRYRRVGDSDWLDMAAEGDNRGSVVSSVLADGEDYEVEGAIATYGRAQESEWIAASGSPFTAVADPSLPGPPTAFNATGSAGYASLSWTTPNASNFKATRIYRGATSSFDGATLIKTLQGSALQPMSYIDGSRPAGVFYYWVRAVNPSGLGDATSTAGPATVTVT